MISDNQFHSYYFKVDMSDVILIIVIVQLNSLIFGMKYIAASGVRPIYAMLKYYSARRLL